MVIPKPLCQCSPWGDIVGGTFDGVQKVSAFGGKLGDCEEAAEVTITGPGGINIVNPKSRQVLEPAANGKWTVTAIVCGEKKTCEIIRP